MPDKNKEEKDTSSTTVKVREYLIPSAKPKIVVNPNKVYLIPHVSY